MANPFYIDPANRQDLDPLMSGIGNILQQNRERKRQAALQEGMRQAYSSNDPDQVAQFMMANPEAGKILESTMEFRNKATAADLDETLREFLADPTEEKAQELTERRTTFVRGQGGDPRDTEGFRAEYRENPLAAARSAEMLYASRDPKGYEAYKATTGGLPLEDRMKISKEVGGYIGPTQEIYEAAESLDSLKASSSPAAQNAAMFKFMKALDPSSTVRESELGLVYSAEGIAKGLAAQLNKAIGEGGLSKSNFADMVNTAKRLANSAVSSSDRRVRSALDTYEAAIPENYYDLQLKRLPDPFDIPGETPLFNKKGWKLHYDPKGKKAYVGPDGQIEEIK